jgi:hypothetical protein
LLFLLLHAFLHGHADRLCNPVMLLTFVSITLPLPLCCRCSDDVDDQYTEKGRLLIRKEGEALANGLRIGEILAADDMELQLPGLTGRKRERAEGGDSGCGG